MKGKWSEKEVEESGSKWRSEGGRRGVREEGEE